MKLRLGALLSILLLVLCTEKHNDTIKNNMATFYIDPTGVDNISRDGTSTARAWKTLSYACSRALANGDIIHVNPGVYSETAQSNLAEGVSIEGEGVSSHIVSSVSNTYSFTIALNSSNVGSNGNQHISGLKMDGNNLTAYGAISVLKRSNVEIFNCTFVDFNYCGISFNGGYEAYTPPAIYATGNKFHDNTVINCSGYFPAGDKYNGDGKYAVGVDGQDGILIYNNLLDQTSRSPGSNGYLIKGVPGLNKGIKIFSNIIKKAPYDNQTWDFAIELWLSRGGIEIYDNTVTAGIDLSGAAEYSGISTQKGSYDYSVYIHNNIIGPESISPYENVVGIYLEQSTEYAIIEANYIKNVCVGIDFPTYSKVCPISNIDIRYNILDNIGVSDGGPADAGYGILFLHTNADNQVSNVRVCNNTIIGHTGNSLTLWGIQVPDIGPVNNIVIRNNIVQNFDNSPVSAGGTGGTSGVSIDQISIENNIFYNNGNNNLPRYNGLTPTNNTTRNNITSNPLFVSSSDYHLQAGSPAINAGLDIGLTTDYNGSSIVGLPDIGALEFGSAPIVPVTSVTVTGTGGATSISVSGGTLQMIATVLPANATDKTVVWSVTNGTGSATINQSGLLTAIKNGTVTVKAISNG